MSTVIPIYPFDPDGDAVTNLVHEQQPLESSGVFDNFYLIPRAAPFYAESVKLKLFPGGMDLIEGKHYNFGHHFMDASHTIGQAIYGSITFYDRTMKGIVDMEYQTLGGVWTLDEATILAILENEVRNPRITSWETVVELPERFPVVNHKFDIDDFVGMSEVTEELSGIRDAIAAKGGGAIDEHINNKANPHDVTKQQVGLGLVDNFPTAAVTEAQAGTVNNRFMTPLRTRQAIESIALAALSAHTTDKNNPHETTKAHVGLGLVQNLQLASQAEAEAASSNARYMTPLRTRELVDFIVGTAFKAHAENMNNPHQTNKGHVGLGSVNNFGLATDAEASAATSNELYMTPLRTRATVMALVGTRVDAHIGDLNNPHQTSKVHVGLGLVQNFGLATEAEARDATRDDRYMTPLKVRQAISELAGDNSAHFIDYSNPHRVTKAQVNLGNVDNYATADDAEAKAATAVNRFMTPAGVRLAIEALTGGSIAGHLEDFDNPHRVTAAQVGSPTLAVFNAGMLSKLGTGDTAANASQVFGMSQAALQTWIASLTASNSAKLEGLNLNQVTTEILKGKAADSALLDGRTYAAIKQEIGQSVEGSSIQYVIPGVPLVIDGANGEVTPPASWLKFGTVGIPVDALICDFSLMLTGGRNDESLEDELQSNCILSVSATAERPVDGELTIGVKHAQLRHLNRVDSPIQLGYKVVGTGPNTVVELWIKTATTRTEVIVTELSYKRFVLGDLTTPENLSDLIVVRPAGLIDCTEVIDQSGEGDVVIVAVTDTLNALQASFS